MANIDYNEYVCMFNYSDGYADYKRGDSVVVSSITFNTATNRPFVYFENGHPVDLEAFQFCFIHRINWFGEGGGKVE